MGQCCGQMHVRLNVEFGLKRAIRGSISPSAGAMPVFAPGISSSTDSASESSHRRSRAPSSSSSRRSRRARTRRRGRTSRRRRRTSSENSRRSPSPRPPAKSGPPVVDSIAAGGSPQRTGDDGAEVGEARDLDRGAMSNTDSNSDAKQSIIRRAAALWQKYKVRENTVELPVHQIGAHPANRDGQGPSSSRCLELTATILRFGFDTVEANSNGVLVEQKPGSSHIHTANKRFAESDALLAPVLDKTIIYGTLSHSTLNQLMKNIHAKCPGVHHPRWRSCHKLHRAVRRMCVAFSTGAADSHSTFYNTWIPRSQVLSTQA